MKKFTIGYRTLKTAIGAAVAIAIAQHFGLQFYTAAGVLTILSVQSTKRKSVHAVYTRVIASLVGMFLSFVFFESLGYYPIVFGIVLLFYIPIIVSLKVSEGFVSSVVIITHIYSLENFTTSLLINELYLMLIGFGMGLAVNMYMPDISNRLSSYRYQIEENYKIIFSEIANYLRNGDTLWDGKQFIDSIKLLEDAKALAYQEVQNHLTRRENAYYLYFDMRESQLEIIERVLPKITALPAITEQSILVADFLEELSNNVHPGNTAHKFRRKLEQVKEDFAKMPLPTSHDTFLAQAALYQFIEEMDAYLEIKQSYWKLQTGNVKSAKWIQEKGK